VVDHLALWVHELGLRETDRSIIGSPLFWTFGCAMTALTPLLAGSMVALLERFDASEFLRIMRDHDITHLQGVPTQYELMLSHPDAGATDLSRLRLIQLGGSSSAAGLAQRLLARAPSARLVSAYGLTEAVAVATWTPPDASIEDVVETVGLAAPDLEWSVRDPDSTSEVAQGEVGELWLRGHPVMLGYVSSGGHALQPPEKGWLRTGDLVCADERGYLSIAGRSVDAFKRGGVNVYPAETETVLADHPAVGQVGIVGVPDERFGEVGAAFVVLREDMSATSEEIIDWCTQRLARYKVPAHVRFVTSLPLTPTGKIQKGALRERWKSPTTGSR
jgi:fatty-acyl-CoA synthase